MGKSFIIASDLDGTLADHTRMNIRFAKELGYALEESEASSDVMKTKIPAEDYKKITSMIYGTGSLHASVMSHAKEVVEKLAAHFGSVYIISRRGTGIEGDYGREWIQVHFIPPFQKEHIVFVQSDEEKEIVAQNLGVSVYIDDKQEVLDKMASVAYRILFDPHDNFSQRQSRYPRIRAWEEFPDMLEKMLKGA